MVDLTGEFRRLAGVQGISAPAPGGFIRRAQAEKGRLRALRDLRDRAATAEINQIQASVGELESMVEDLSDLPMAPGQDRDQVAHRRGVVAALYEELRSLAAKVQGEQVSELQHEAEVAGYFMAAAPRRPVKPPPSAAMEDLRVPDTLGGSEALRAEEQRLLATFTTDLDKIQETRAKIEEVSTMVGFFATKVAEQTEQTDEILELTEESTGYVEAAEKNLQRAIQHSNSYRFYVVCWFLGSAMFLLVVDYIDARWSPI
ncbi:unnamed protein product [Effrenium voratum]|uniref:t-SNARE coiled-coil homology domain-containing protein n=1 Tax=Effrenium voratum TaxID=2562239 RepID=A0AA36MJI1_9DINO|nr:unnamed protein product [Effrenium voratum]CAJ1374669.1 unnamed protein product [Effrenium voratum]CAJ1425926.1 unnamed protein product [Effrenium voratum]